MLRASRGQGRGHGFVAATLGLALALAAVPGREAAALITGGEGNRPVSDPGWPKGAAALFNVPGRVAWWEGPPFGGGQWHAECRGDARALNAVLVGFAALDVKTKRVVVHDGAGHSFWLNPNREAEKQAAARVDWVLTVWQPASWERLRKLPGDLNPTDPGDAAKGPPASIDVYAGGNLRWADVVVPPGLEVVDQRLEAHGFSPADGVVLEGKVIDLATKRPLPARMRLQRIAAEPKGYRYTLVAEAASDAQGRWVLKKAPAGWFRVVVEADGYVPRVVGYARHEAEPGWSTFDGALARPAPVSGRITDDEGQPIAGVAVRFHDVMADGRVYESPHEYAFTTDAEGRFRADEVPIGRARVWLNKAGYCRPGLGASIAMPGDAIALQMKKSARVRVTVDFSGTRRPAGYMVHIEPEGGEAVGKWSGSGNIDAKDQIAYEDVPPGRYVLRGQPNPSSGDQRTKPVAVDLKGGQTAEVTLHAR